MRLPAVAIAAAFASGIALGLHPVAARNTSSLTLPAFSFSAITLLIFLGFLLLKFDRLVSAAAASLLTWVLLGFLGAIVSQQPRPADHITLLVEQGRVPLHTPLRWYGQLRDEPARLPWGYGYEIELSGVEYEEELHTTVGGIRLSFSARPDQRFPVELHAGDAVTVLTEARLPQVFKDEGAFDRRAYLAQQNIDLVSTLRAPELIRRVSLARPTAATQLALVRRRLRDEVDELFSARPQVAAVLRAMLLGDRSFVDREESTDFQKTGVFHVLVVAGLHVGALGFALYWACRKLGLSPTWRASFTLAVLFAYVAVVEQRAPVLRATLMATIVVLGGFFYRRLDLLNSAALAELALLVARPLALRDSSFELTFVAIGCIAGLALPWLGKTVQPYARALVGWRDVTRDAAHEPRAIQFRIDVRSLGHWVSSTLPQRLGRAVEGLLVGGLSLTLRIWELLVLTVVLQMGMLPLMARDFHRITLSGPLANLAAAPLTGVVVPLGFLTLASGLIFYPLGKLPASLLAWLTVLLLHIVQWFAHFPRWSYRIPAPPIWLVTTFFGAAVFLAATMRLNRPALRKIVWVIGALWAASALAVAIFPFGSRWEQGKLEVTILDVGQGDSLLVVFPQGKTMLIDGGGAFSGFPGREEHNGIDPGEEAVSPYLWSRGFQKLDVVALTHAHQDHLGGLIAVLENFRVGRLWIGREVNSVALKKLEELARAKKIPIEFELRGKSFSWEGVEGEFLWPEIVPEEIAPSAKNNDSLVLRLRYGSRSLMLPGDAEKQVEKEMLEENNLDSLRADVLKVGHHGSKNSTTPEFLAAMQPRVGIISSGEANPYGHPSPELLERLESAGVRVLRTDRDGAVHVLTDGIELEITCFVECREAARATTSAQTHSPNHKQDGEKK